MIRNITMAGILLTAVVLPGCNMFEDPMQSTVDKCLGSSEVVQTQTEADRLNMMQLCMTKEGFATRPGCVLSDYDKTSCYAAASTLAIGK